MLPAVAAAIRHNVAFGIDRACLLFRHKREAIYIAADTAAECEDHASFLTTLATRHPGVSMQEIHAYLHETVTTAIAEENSDTLEMFAQWRRDEAEIAAIFARGPTITELVAIADYERGCMQWLAQHHRDASVRERMVLALVEIDALHAANAERASRLLERAQANGRDH
jgi:hypothetical protein